MRATEATVQIVIVPERKSGRHEVRLFDTSEEAKRFKQRMLEERGIECELVENQHWSDVREYISC